MKPKTIITFVIVAFVAVAVAYLVVKEVRRAGTPEKAVDDGARATAAAPTTETAVEEEEETAALGGQVVVYYFYFGERDVTCLKVERYTKEALERGFAEELAKGSVLWKPTDAELPQNRHLKEHYGLDAKAVLVSELREGEEARWKSLTKVWQLTGDKGLFIKYIQDEVRAYLPGE